MRDINKQIKKVFLDYIKSQNEPDDNVETATGFSVGRKLIDLFK